MQPKNSTENQTVSPDFTPLLNQVNPRKVVIVQRRLTHYRVPLFEQLRTRLIAEGVDLQLVYGDPTATERLKNDDGFIDWAIHAPCRYFLGGHICLQNFQQQAQDADLVIITQENKLLYNLIALFIKRPKRLAFWGHGRNMQALKKQAILELFKKRTTLQVDWWFAYTQLSKDLVEMQGFSSDKITDLENTIDTKSLAAQLATVGNDELLSLRDEMGLATGRTALFIGSLYNEKRIDFLIEVAVLVASKLPGFCLIVVGDGPQRDLVEAASKAHACINYVGSKNGIEKARLLCVADIMMNPGLVGLGILDSFLAGIPMVTTDCGLHSPEIAYLKNNENGLMTANTLETYVDAVTAVLDQDALRTRLSQGARDSAAHYTIENMTENFVKGILQCLELTA